MRKSGRESGMELLRIISMLMIVIYHFHCHVLQYADSNVAYQVIQIPLHIAVINFILISGYFGIRLSAKSLCKFVTKVGFYALFILLIAAIFFLLKDGIPPIGGDIIWEHCFFISHTELWFVTAYFSLLITSPFLNNLLERQNKKQRILFLIVFFILQIWIGNLSRAVSFGGKTLSNFIFIYSLGWTIKEYNIVERVKGLWLLLVYLMLNAVVIVAFMQFNGSILGDVIWLASFPYNSPFCILSALLFFGLFTKMRFHSKGVNYIGASAFAVYLIQEDTIVGGHLYSYVAQLHNTYSVLPLEGILFLFATAVFAACIAIDKVTLPIQRLLSHLGINLAHRAYAKFMRLNRRSLPSENPTDKKHSIKS